MFQASGITHPIFAPKSDQQSEELDLNDIFADYFINELYDAPDESCMQPTHPASFVSNSVNNTASSVRPATHVNSSQGINPVVKGADVTLPTGRGVQTMFHAQALQSTPSTANPIISQLQKKQKIEGLQSQGNQIQPQSAISANVLSLAQHVQNPLQQYPLKISSANSVASVPPNVVSSKSGISGRLGFSIIGGQLAMPSALPKIHPAPSPDLNISAHSVGDGKNMSNLPKSQLPVGVGIRLGNLGGALGGNALLAAGGSEMTSINHPSSSHPIMRSQIQHAAWNNMQPAGQVSGSLAMQLSNPLWGRAPLPNQNMSEQAVAERRQRNREHAKRSRVRKKFMLESLQEEVNKLQKVNTDLRMMVLEKLPDVAHAVIEECCAKSPLFSNDCPAPKQKIELTPSDFSLIRSLTSGQQNFVLSDPRLPDNPIVYASEGFYKLTGYSKDQVLGRNCRFLQGPGTNPKAVDTIRTAISNGTDASCCLLNYKADGTPFWNQFFVAALRDSDNCIVNYVGVQTFIEPDSGQRALEDKVNSVLPLMNKEGDEDGEDDSN
mmetsp:Transcript_49215/g.96246  ORF Transcript_49215/g.96246 Transcript_49215/m.96246 type:complete len:551 (-) Transcript_49215:293-1945(-)